MAMPAFPPGPRAPRRVRRFGNVLTRQLCNKQSVQTWAATTTHHTTTTAEFKSGAVRVFLQNIHSAPITFNSVSVAPSNAIGTGAGQYTPTGTWTQVLFGGNASITIPAGTEAEPSIVVSDWVLIASVARIDGGTLPVWMFRTVQAAGSYCRGNYDMTPWAAENGIAQKRPWAMWTWVGDGGATGNAAGFVGTPTAFPVMLGFQYAASRPGITFGALDDSLKEGAVNGSVGNFGNGYIWQAINILRAMFPQTPIEFMNSASSGTPTNQFPRRLHRAIAAGLHPDVVLFTPFSPNDATPSQATIDADLVWWKNFVNACYENNIEVLPVTPFPNTAAAWDAVADAFRLFIRSEIVNGSSTPYIDTEIMGTGATPNRLNPALTADGTHGNDAGNLFLATQQAVPAMAQYIRT